MTQILATQDGAVVTDSNPFPTKLTGSSASQDTLLNAVAKRDTVTIESAWFSTAGFKAKRLLTYTSLDQSFTVTTMWRPSSTGSEVAAGAPVTVTASGGFNRRTESDSGLLGLDTLAGEIKFKFVFAVAPTTGAVSAWFQRSVL